MERNREYQSCPTREKTTLLFLSFSLSLCLSAAVADSFNKILTLVQQVKGKRKATTASRRSLSLHLFFSRLIMLTGLHPNDSNPYSALKDSSSSSHPLLSGGPWRHHPPPPPPHPSHHVYSNPYVYDAAAAVALVSYSPYASSYSSHMDLAGRRKNATRETTATLKAWLYEHRKNPYPTKSEKVYLAIMTKMTLTQVSTWFANARRRLKKENKMTWSPRNRTNEDEEDEEDEEEHDERQAEESTTSEVTDDEPSPIGKHPLPSTINSYLSNPLTVLQHQPFPPAKDEFSRKRKLEELSSSSPPQAKKKPSAIWSLADMAEKNENKKSLPSFSTGHFPVTKARLLSSTDGSSPLPGAFKRLK